MPQQTLAQKQKTAGILEKFRTAASDTGSPEVQVALITNRINELTEHLRGNRKDFSTQRGLLNLVGQRRRLLSYLKDTDLQRYQTLIGKLELRK